MKKVVWKQKVFKCLGLVQIGYSEILYCRWINCKWKFLLRIFVFLKNNVIYRKCYQIFGIMRFSSVV